MSGGAARRAALAHRRGRFDLRFRRDSEGRTFIARQHVSYPFHLTRPFYAETAPAGMLRLYVQSASGGLYANDRLALRFIAEPGAEAHVTTQGATVANRMPGGAAEQTVMLEAGAGALLEYLPDPLILFPEADVLSRIEVRAAVDAHVILGEAFLGHDPTGAGRPHGRLHAETRIARPDGTLLCLDRFAISGATLAEGHPGIAPHGSAHASLYALGPSTRCPGS
ncbi:MAG: urease accessory protein UreD, partial [Alphaproteobacteria bacterium]|nr:urease accessory protein UreD [Alphaproteobacteria bacterium]